MQKNEKFKRQCFHVLSLSVGIYHSVTLPLMAPENQDYIE